jgi:hypothetical protein
VARQIRGGRNVRRRSGGRQRAARVRRPGFEISDEPKGEIYESGREEAKKFLDKIKSGASPAEPPPASPP